MSTSTEIDRVIKGFYCIIKRVCAGIFFLTQWIMRDVEVILQTVFIFQPHFKKYRQVSNIRRTKSQHLKDSGTVLRMSLPNPLKPDVKSKMKM